MTKTILPVVVVCTLMIIASSSVFCQREVLNLPAGWRANSLTFDENQTLSVLVALRTTMGVKWIVAQWKEGKWIEHEVICSDQIDTVGEYFRLTFINQTWYMYGAGRLYWSPSLDSCFSLAFLRSPAVNPLRDWRKPILLADQVYFSCESDEILKIDTVGTQVVTTVSPGAEVFQAVGGNCSSIMYSNSAVTGIQELSVPFDGWGTNLSVITTPKHYSTAPKAILSIQNGLVTQYIKGSTQLAQAVVIDARLIGSKLYFLSNGVEVIGLKYYNPRIGIAEEGNESILEYPLPDSVLICFDVVNYEDNFFVATSRGLFTKMSGRDIAPFQLDYHFGLPAEVELNKKGVASLGISNKMLYALKSNRVFLLPISDFNVTSVSDINHEVAKSSAFPNPADGDYVTIPLLHGDITDVKLVSAHGEFLNVSYANDGEFVTVQTAQLSSGMYYVVALQDGRKFVRPFTVLR